MCGLVGLVDLARGAGVDDLNAVVTAMSEAVRHRGPDGDGVWVDEGVALGHRRLAVLDLSERGAQPMVSRCGRYVLVFNGEIYDFRALRRRLEQQGSSFRGHSDTEVLLEAISQWGVLPALQAANGMFALAVWDRSLRELTLARDRLGEKPMYYGFLGGHLVFGSQLAALRRHPAFVASVDRGALALLLRLSYIPAPHTVYEGVSKLPAGHVLQIRAEDGRTPRVSAFGSLEEAAVAGTAEPFVGTDAQATDILEDLLRDVVAIRLEADVPLAVFLSGGIDSSLVTALAQQQAGQPLRTFTVGVAERGGPDDERQAAAAVAAHLGTEHEEVHLRAEDGLATVQRLADVWDEPFADPSQVPTAMLCVAARERATVCLSGDGGDEVFGGYNRYVLGQAAYARSRRVPAWLRRAAADRLLASPTATWDRRWQRVEALLPGATQLPAPGAKLHKLAGLLRAEDLGEVYLGLVSQWPDPGAVVLGAREPVTAVTDRTSWPVLADATQQMLFVDSLTVLPDDMLVKVDRASMAVGLEVRAPLIDHRVVELAWHLRPDQKIRDGRGKWLLRQVAERHVPATLLDRPKLGFDPPLDAWLRGPLRTWAEDLLAADRLRSQGLFAVDAVRAVWVEHLSGARDHGYALWAVLMAQQWLDRWDAT